MKRIEDGKIYFNKTDELAILPTKRDEDAGFDVYAIQNDEVIVIAPGETKMINTGIRSAFNSNYVLLGRERGSTGSKGLRLGAGVIDSGYRGDIFIPINNTSNKTFVIAPREMEEQSLSELSDWHYPREDLVFYPKDKGIGQLILVPIGIPTAEYLSIEDFDNLPAGERGTGALGSSGK